MLRIRAGAVLVGVVFLAWARGAEEGVVATWVQDSYADFAAGRLDAAGQNLFVSRDGKVRTIQRFDLNQDGYLDLVFNSTHDRASFLPAVAASVGPDRRPSLAQLAVEGSIQVAIGDLNRDGHADAVFCPNDSGLQNPRRFVTVLWGGEDGWSARRSNGLLPVHAAQAVALADLDRDGSTDIVVLNGEAWLPGQPAGAIVRVFWGSPDGFLLSRKRDFGVAGASALAAADFDGDGAADVALVAGSEIRILWSGAPRTSAAWPETRVALPSEAAARALAAGDAGGDGRADLVVATGSGSVLVAAAQPGRAFAAPVVVRAFDASHVAVGDLDGDGHPDLVLTSLATKRALGGEAEGAVGGAGASVRVLWGDAAGFDAARVTELPAPYAAAAAIGDLDGDGRPDLAVAVHQGAASFTADSALFFNLGGRRFERGVRGVPTEGALGVAIAPRAGNLPARAVFASSLRATVGEAVPLDVYWGGPKGFDPARRWQIPFRSGYESSAADLDGDGFVDLVALNSQHGGVVDDPYSGANIFWGSAAGFDLDKRRTVIGEPGLASSAVADLDRDGYLDLVLGAFASPAEPCRLVVHYGSAQGFGKRRVALDSEGNSTSVVVADFNRDDWLDLAVVSAGRDVIRIFWGGAAGFDAARQAHLSLPYAISLETADLNQDGWLDLVAGSYQDAAEEHHDTGLTIFWGSADGFRSWNAQWLPGFAPIGPVVADFDGDGYLDVFTPHYLGELTRESLPSYLYWGAKEGFAPRRRTILITDSAHDALAGDFDGDGKLDLAVSCHTRDGDHHTMSKVFYNDGRRFRAPRVEELPTAGTHWMWDQDMGHVYDRKWRQTYESSAFRWNAPARAGRLRFRAETAGRRSLGFEVRTAASAEGLGRAAWRPVASGRFEVADADRALQYRAIFKSANGDSYPVLDRVEIALTRNPAAPAARR